MRRPPLFVLTPSSYFALFKQHSSAEMAVLGYIIAHGGPEWVGITGENLAKIAGCTVRGIQKAIANLERAGLIERRLRGRANEYRALLPEYLS